MRLCSRPHPAPGEGALSERAVSHLLVVDDERHVRGMLRDLLSAWGRQAEEAADATEGRTFLKQKGDDLVVTNDRCRA